MSADADAYSSGLVAEMREKLNPKMRRTRPRTQYDIDREIIEERMNDIRADLFERDDTNDLCEGCPHLSVSEDRYPYGNATTAYLTISCDCEDWRGCMRMSAVFDR